MAEYARSMRAAGIRRYQLKLGDDPGIDAARLRAVADAAGDWDFMTCDANGGWTLGQAARMVRAVADFDVYVEQPCATLENVASLRARTKLPVVVDESITGPTDLVDAVRLRACDAVNLKASRLGGLTKAALVRDLAVSLGLQVIVEDEAGGGDIVQSAMVHLAASTPPRALLGASTDNRFQPPRRGKHGPGYHRRLGASPRDAGPRDRRRRRGTRSPPVCPCQRPVAAGRREGRARPPPPGGLAAGHHRHLS